GMPGHSQDDLYLVLMADFFIRQAPFDLPALRHIVDENEYAGKAFPVVQDFPVFELKEPRRFPFAHPQFLQRDQSGKLMPSEPVVALPHYFQPVAETAFLMEIEPERLGQPPAPQLLHPEYGHGLPGTIFADPQIQVEGENPLIDVFE